MGSASSNQNYRVRSVPSTKNVADALSRLTNIRASDQSLQDDRYVCLVGPHAVPTALRTKEIERISAQDPELQSVRYLSHQRQMGQCS